VECILAFALIVIVLTAAIIWGVLYALGYGKSHACARLAQKYHGQVLRGYLFGRPRVQFLYGRELFHLSARKLNHSSRSVVTQIECSWPDPEFQCEVFTRGFTAVKSGVPLSNSADLLSKVGGYFQVHTNDERRAEQFLSEGVQWELSKLLAIQGDQQVYLRVDQGALCIRKLTWLTRFEYLDEFTLVALELFDQAMLTRSDGIAFIDAGAAQIIDEARCQVCGEDILSDMVFCRRCKTPHHIECWHYNGSCSIFGCQETRYSVPMVADSVTETSSEEDET
tara:strand:+ start:551 stop:1393 length:843 start_codon:yes stop_codon:yes gene_type:complete